MVREGLLRRRPGRFPVGAAILLLGAVASRAVADEPPAVEGTGLSREMKRLVDAHNREREEAKLAPLVPNAKLTAAALGHARDMAEHDAMSHDGSDGSKFNERIERQGYKGRRTAENVAAGQRSVGDVIGAWMNSEHHRENILGPYDEIGVARAESEDGKPYWCTTFGLSRPRLDPSGAARGVVDALNRERTGAGRPPLEVNPKLEDVARQLAGDLAARGELGGEKPAEPSTAERLRGVGYRFRRLGESAATGQVSAAEAVQTWLDSPDHRENFLGPFTEIGVGYATSEKGIPFWTAVLAQPLK
jgi:uncharacterized protein YkwD